MTDSGSAGLARRLGTGDGVLLGLGSMMGAGVFASFAPAAEAAGAGLLLGLALAALVAYCNATSSAQLAATFPVSGGTYVPARDLLGPWWGFLAGWSFVVGKTASCAAMALTFAAYVAPTGQERPVAVAAVAGLAAVNLRGVTRTARLTRVIVTVVLVSLAGVVAASAFGGQSDLARVVAGGGRASVYDVLQSAGLLFFAFAGYARIATLGEEVRDPQRTIPRAIQVALGITVTAYPSIAVAILAVLGAAGVAATASPLAAAVAAGDWSELGPLVRVGAAAASLGALLALIAGVGTHEPGDGEGERPAALVGRGAPATPGAAPRRDRAGGPRVRARSHGGPARGDRVLLVRRAALLRGRERGGLPRRTWSTAASPGRCRFSG